MFSFRADRKTAGPTGSNEPIRLVSYDEYVLAVGLNLARRHQPVWSWREWRRICRCGSDLPCRIRHRIPVDRGHWPSEAGSALHDHAAAPYSESGNDSMKASNDESTPSRGEQIQEAEREAARQRILALAEAERIPAEETTRAIPDRRWRRGR